MPYIHAALALHASGKEIDEANLRRILKAMNVEAEEVKLRALLMLVSAIRDSKTSLKCEGKEIAMASKTSNTRAPHSAQGQGEGRYLYCVAYGGLKMSFGKIGIEGSEVYTMPYKDLCAVVHNCPAEPYDSEDEELVKKWVLAHENVIEIAWEKFGTVLPLGFDTIIEGKDGSTPEESMRKWLEEDYENLRQKIEKVRGKAEYGVQISWDPRMIAQQIIEKSPDIKQLNQEISSKSRGAAYMYKQKLEKAIKKEMESLADKYFKDFFGNIKDCVDEVKVEKTKKEKEKQMLMSLSCLTSKDKVEKLGVELEKISNLEGFFVKFTGPWPPYSFVGK